MVILCWLKNCEFCAKSRFDRHLQFCAHTRVSKRNYPSYALKHNHRSLENAHVRTCSCTQLPTITHKNLDIPVSTHLLCPLHLYFAGFTRNEIHFLSTHINIEACKISVSMSSVLQKFLSRHTSAAIPLTFFHCNSMPFSIYWTVIPQFSLSLPFIMNTWITYRRTTFGTPSYTEKKRLRNHLGKTPEPFFPLD